MKLSTREDIEAPVEHVFELLSDFDGIERSVLRRGVDVQRTSDHSTPVSGMCWSVRFQLRGRSRKMEVVLAEYDRPNAMRFNAESNGISGVFTVELIALSKRRTRMAVALDVRPKTLPARLLVQSFKLAKANITKQFKLRVASYAKQLEERLHSA